MIHAKLLATMLTLTPAQYNLEPPRYQPHPMYFPEQLPPPLFIPQQPMPNPGYVPSLDPPAYRPLPMPCPRDGNGRCF